MSEDIVSYSSATPCSYLPNSIVHFPHSSFALSAVESEEDFGLGSCPDLESSVDVDQVLELVFLVVVNKRLNGPLNA